MTFFCGACSPGGAPAVEPGLITRMGSFMARKPSASDNHWQHVTPRRTLGVFCVVPEPSGGKPITALTSEDGGVVLAYTGHIVNATELKKVCRSKRHTFATELDAEVVLHLYEDYGIACASSLRGPFSFALWDTALDRIFLVRDRLGERSIFHAQAGNVLLFASDAKAILKSGLIARRANTAALAAFVESGYIPPPATAFDGISKVPPGCLHTFDGTYAETWKYWKPTLSAGLAEPFPEGAEKFFSELFESVELRARDTSPPSVLVDTDLGSAVVAGLANLVYKKPTRTLAVGFGLAAFDQLEHSRTVARHYSADHSEFLVDLDVDIFFSLLAKLQWHLGGPCAVAEAVDFVQAARMCGSAARAVLYGFGLEEMLRLSPAPEPGLEAVGESGPEAKTKVLRKSRTGGFVKKVSSGLASLIAGLAAKARRKRTPEFVAAFLAQLTGTDPASGSTEELRADPRLAGPFGLPGLVLAETLFPAIEACGNAASVEFRLPFFDHLLVEFACGMPRAWLAKKGTEDGLAESAFKNLVPQLPSYGGGVFRRAPEPGAASPARSPSALAKAFEIPDAGRPRSLRTAFAILRTEEAKARLLDGRPALRELVDGAGLEKAIGGGKDASGSNPERLWRLLAVSEWHAQQIARDLSDSVTWPACASGHAEE
ncbi:MAG: asparagine synthase-related protein [Planctomycetota bacterium]|nr:asparagine synthase-related protein [Planctomycetota bacterium]